MLLLYRAQLGNQIRPPNSYGLLYSVFALTNYFIAYKI